MQAKTQSHHSGRSGASGAGGTPSLRTWSTGLLVLMAAILFLYGVDIVLEPLPPGASELFQKFASSALFFGAAALCVRKGRQVRGESSAWWLFALGLTLWGLASSYYSVVLWNAETVPIPSMADALWLAFYVPTSVALLVLLRRRARNRSRQVLLDALVAGLGVGGASAAFALDAALANRVGGVAATATSLAYPIGDLVLLMLVVGAMTVAGWKGSGAWRWIAVAFGLFVVADSVYLVQVADGVYATGEIVDLGWPAAALLVGVAAWWPEVQVTLSSRAESSTVVAAVSGLAALGLLVVDHFSRTNQPAIWLATATLVAILVRLYLTVRDNVRMLGVSRAEATTDALTGLGNRRQLTADLITRLADLSPAEPVLLTIFDLDGFKQYNDTFGHMTGDQLLQRLGDRLSSALATKGHAYRMGGDEFCTLWSVSANGDEAATLEDARAALTETGEAFTIGCSWGSVRLPDETTDPNEALRLADTRMYARKRAARSSAAQQSADVLMRALAERDAELSGHVDRVASLALATADLLGVTEDDLDVVRQTALLHDVGKIAIPHEILGKPGPLDDTEWAFVRRHTLIGERILSAAPALAHIGALVRSTHERFDGRGYPDGLAGRDMPLIASIVAVCDAYDAMTSERAYRAARSNDAAVAELRRCSGTQFDPVVVGAFLTALADSGEFAPEPRDDHRAHAKHREWGIAAALAQTTHL